MTQPTSSYQVPAHPSGLDMRTQLNIIVLAILGDNAGPTEPIETYPGMMWGDTTANRLKRRNNVNDGWIDIGPLDDFLGDIKKLVSDTASTKVNRAGDTMTGSLYMKGFPIMLQNGAGNNYGYIGPYGAAGGAGPASGMGFVDSTLTSWNFQVDNAGNTYTKGNGTISGGLRVDGGRLQLRQPGVYGEMAIYSQDGTGMFLRGRSSGGGMQWVNNDYNNVPADMDNAGNLRLLSFSAANICVIGSANYSTNGDISGPAWNGAWLSQWLAAYKADKNANCNWQVGPQESGWITINGNQTVDVGQPYVLVGLRNSGSSIYLRCTYLRNN